MNNRAYDLLNIIWPLQAGRTFLTADGVAVTVVRTGERDAAGGGFTGAEVSVGGEKHRGRVAVGLSQGHCNTDCILQVVESEGESYILMEDGTFLPRVVLEAGPLTRITYDLLKEGAAERECARHIARMEDVHRTHLYQGLVMDRLCRKCSEVEAFYTECDCNWNEAMYITLARTMSGPKNKEAFTELARRVKYAYISRESGSLRSVEALLLGTSGLLELYVEDSYTRSLKNDFDYLRRKYTISPMMPRRWDLGTTSSGHPVIRMTQLAAFLTTREFLFDNIVRCATVQDCQNLFRAEASQYWSTHAVPGRPSTRRPKGIGPDKANMLGINLVVPMKIAYSRYLNDEALLEEGKDLLEKINREDNSIVNDWRIKGAAIENAHDSQAIIQLNNEYCHKGMCGHCPVGRRVVGEACKKENAAL